MTWIVNRAWAAALLLVLLLGCSNGPRRAPVSGTVMVDGTPLERGVINFIPVDGTTGPGAGGEIRNGQYRLDAKTGPVVGNNRVEIRGFRKTGRRLTSSITPNSRSGEQRDEEIQVVPPEYNDRSTRVVAIKDGDNSLNFELPGVKK